MTANLTIGYQQYFNYSQEVSTCPAGDGREEVGTGLPAPQKCSWYGIAPPAELAHESYQRPVISRFVALFR